MVNFKTLKQKHVSVRRIGASCLYGIKGSLEISYKLPHFNSYQKMTFTTL